MLFNCLLEEIYRNLKWENEGININGGFLFNLRFADDVVLFAEDITQLQNMISELYKLWKSAGLNMNLNKIKLLPKHEKEK